jgi:hypothetical protein
MLLNDSGLNFPQMDLSTSLLGGNYYGSPFMYDSKFLKCFIVASVLNLTFTQKFKKKVR